MAGALLRVLKGLYPAYQRLLRRPVGRLFFMDLVGKTNNFGDVTWLGHPVWQNVLDLWTIQETIAAVRPELLIECGTNRGGSALFYANLFDLLGAGRVLTIDVEKLHDRTHPRVTFLLGSSVDPEIVAKVRATVKQTPGPVLVILDSDHSAGHVAKELEAYAAFVTPGSYLLVQDGVIDVLPVFRAGRPGPLPAIQDFLRRHPEFEVDRARNERFLITHHPLGWLRRLPASPGRPT
jgi:cephalosporin hydroxylase